MENGTRTQFTFYESFFKAVSRIRKGADRAAAYDAIIGYALYGTEPDLDKLPDAAAIAFEVAKPNLDASRRKAASGKKGGESKQPPSKPEAKSSKAEANGKQEKEQEKEQEKDKDKEQMLLTPIPPSKAKHKHGEYGKVLLTDEDLAKLKAEFPDWQARIERLDSYIAQSGKRYKSHLATIRNWARKDEASRPRGTGFQSGNPFLEMLEEERGR